MINLFGYFHAWNPLLVLWTISIFACLEVIGYSINHYWVKLPTFLRPISWILGLTTIVFIWFLLHFAIPFTQIGVVVTGVLLTCFALPFYIKSNGFKSLLETISSHPLPFVILILFLPIVFVKTSLPPYYFDEMAYQYLSPQGLEQMKVWDFNPGGLYQNIPRLLNTAYYLIFALTKTYAPARFLHFAIFFSTFYSISLWLRKNFGLLPSIIFIAFYFFFPIDLIVPATLGYVDIASMSLIVLAILIGIDFVIEKDFRSLIGAAFLWGVAGGVKYTTFIPVVAHLGIASLFYVISNIKDKISIKPTFPWLIKCLVIILLVGGYWEIKNLVMFHNPLYPFVFNCKAGLVEKCPTGSSLFAGWTVPINLKQAPNITNQLFVGNKGTIILFCISLGLLAFQKDKKLISVSLLLILGICIEFILMSKLSGFYMRYFQHVQVLLLTIMILPSASFLSRQIKERSRLLFFIFTILLVALTVKLGRNQLRFVYSNRYLPEFEVSYALGKTDLRDWIDVKFPRMSNFIYFCNTPPENKPFYYVNVDPDLIWFEYDGMARVFMTNCNIQGSPIDFFKPEQLVSELKNLNESFYFTSINPCTTIDKIRKLGYENPQQWTLRLTTNELVCQSEQIIPSLYYFDSNKM